MQTPEEETLQKAIQFYEKVRVTAASRLSFAQSGADGFPATPGHPSERSLPEMWDGSFQRIERVMRSLVEHSELPDQVHELSLSESTESRLAATICTAYFTWMIADLSELFSGGNLHTVGPMIENMIHEVGQAHTSQNTSLRNSSKSESLRSTSTQAPTVAEVTALVEQRLRDLSNGKEKKRTDASKTSNSKSLKGKKQRSAKKKKAKSKKRSVRKKGR